MFLVERIPSEIQPKHQIVALGSDTHQRISWAKNGRIFSLQPKKDFLSLEDFYNSAAEFLLKKYKVNPVLLSFDPHPLFVSNQQAASLREKYFPKAKLQPVFHHVAHLANFGIEVGSFKNFIGVAFDGTGYGSDGRVWGGEFFLFKHSLFKREAHLKYQLLPGNEAAIWEPWRIAFSILYQIYSKDIFHMKLDFLKNVQRKDLDLVCQMIEKKFNAPMTSSAGRLFDAVSALLNIKTKVKKEAEAAVALEKVADCYKGKTDAYPFDIEKKENMLIVDFTPMFKQMVKELRLKKDVSEMASRFHTTLACAIGSVCARLEKKYAVNNVFFSGGVFMNNLLKKEIQHVFQRRKNVSLFLSKCPTTTDLGISQGQIAACFMERLCA